MATPLKMLNLPSLWNIGYKRNKIPKPSPGVGGPCLSKDPYILNYNFQKSGIKAEVSLSARKINENMIKNMFSKIEKYLKNTKKNKKNTKIFILGMAFKGDPQTSDIRGSSSIDLLKILKKNNYKKVSLHDPIVNQSLEFGYKFMGLNQDLKMLICNFYDERIKDLKILGLISKMSNHA